MTLNQDSKGVICLGDRLLLKHPRFIICRDGSNLTEHLQHFIDPKSFARAIVTSPSIHQGFDIEVKHDNESKLMSITEEDCFSNLEAIWYRDIEPRISPPLRGSLTGLIFEGIDPDDSGAGLSASNTTDRVSELRTCIADGLKTINTSTLHGIRTIIQVPRREPQVIIAVSS